MAYMKRDREINPEDIKERCSVSGELCLGICRKLHLEEFGIRCPAWYTDDMVRGKGGGRGRR